VVSGSHANPALSMARMAKIRANQAVPPDPTSKKTPEIRDPASRPCHLPGKSPIRTTKNRHPNWWNAGE
jgi:hypothetical protein